MVVAGDERVALMALLRTLYRLRPDFPMRFLVGDSLFAHSATLSRELYMRYGAHPVSRGTAASHVPCGG